MKSREIRRHNTSILKLVTPSHIGTALKSLVAFGLMEALAQDGHPIWIYVVRKGS